MASEFTIDIQLTELGFPDLFQDEARAKEVPAQPCPNDDSCAPLTPQNSHTAPPPSPSQDVPPDSVAEGHVLPIASQLTKAPNSAPTQVVPKSGQDKDQSNPGATADDRPRTGTGPSAQLKDTERSVSTRVRKNPEAPAGFNHIKAVGGRGEGKGSGGDGGGSSGRGGKGQGANVNRKRSAAEALDSEETDDSDISEEEEEEEDDEEEEEEEEIASDASVDSLGEQSCRVCGLTLPSAFQLREHMHLHSGARPYRCAECGKQFLHLANYRAHLRGHAQTALVRCRVCEASFDSEESLARHLENSHFEKEFYQCDFCKRIFTCLSECHRHVDLHRHRLERWRHQCPQCDRHFRRRKALNRHVERHAAKRSYLCTDCGQAFDRKNVLFRHSFSHLGLLPYTCVRCSRHFRLASLYRKHVCEPQRIQCVACLGFFRSQEDFQRHKEETGCWGHQGARARSDGIRCMECGQAFQSTEELRKHGSAHQRVLTCSECGKGFRSALLLMSHMGGHAGQRPCLCQRCGLGFPHQQGYDSHRKHCGRPLPAPVAAKKQRKARNSAPTQNVTPQSSQNKDQSDPGANVADRPRTGAGPNARWKAVAPALEKADVPPKGVWKLTLDKCPPPGASLVMFLPVPAGSPSPGLPELASSTLPAGSLPAKEPQTRTPMQVVMGSGSAPAVQEQPSAATRQSPTVVPVARASSAAQGGPSEAACHESLPVPGTSLKLQISRATFVPGTWEQSAILRPAPTGDGARPLGPTLSHGTAAQPPQVTMQTAGATGAGALFGLAAAGGPIVAAGMATTKDKIPSKGRNWTMALKEERLEEEVTKVGGIAVQEEKGWQGRVPPAVKAESALMAEIGMAGQTEDMETATLKESGEKRKPIYIKIELPTHTDCGMPPSSLKVSDGADTCVSGWARPGGSGLWGPGSVTSQKVKQETLVDDGTNAECEGETLKGPGSGTTAEEDGSGVYDSVEVEIRDEEAEGDQEVDGEPHECVSCGEILLEGDLVQHYMQHAMESNSPLHDSSSEIQLLSSPSIPSPYSSPSCSPPMSPPTKRELRPRKKP